MDATAAILEPASLSPPPLYNEPLESMLEPIAFEPRAGEVSLSLSILLTVHNRAATIAQTVGGILAVEYPCAMELIIVDDGSTDGTDELLAAIADDRVTVFRHRARWGKGAALQTATALATGSYLLAFDAGPEYSAEDIPRILRPVLAGRCQVVYGARLSGYNAVYRSRRYIRGNRLLTLLANVLFDACVRDLHTGVKLIPRAMLGGLGLRERGSGLDAEMTAALLKQGVRPFEIPVSYYGGSASAAKGISWRQAAECVRVLLRVRLRAC